MSRFRPITFEYKGKSYTVPAERMMGLIDTIEEHITLAEIYSDGRERKTMRFGKLSAAYSAALNYAGADTSQEEVYFALFGDEAESAADTKAFNIMMSLLTVMTPPKSVIDKLDKDIVKNPQVAGTAGKGSSKRPSHSPRGKKKMAAGS